MNQDDPMEGADVLDAMETNDPAADAAAAHVADGNFATGVQFMWHRVRVQVDGHWVWEAAGNTDECGVADNRVHRYGRDVRFARPDQAVINEDREAQIALAALHAGQTGPTSHQTRINRFALFERYVLERHPYSEYAS